MIASVLAIDPGRIKCGVAVVSRTNGVLVRTIVPKGDIPLTVRLFEARFDPDAIVVGGATGSRDIINSLSTISIPLHIVDEHLSTQQAKARFFKDNPPRWWRRLIPLGLQVPPIPYDDYAAVLLAERFLCSQTSENPAASS